MMDACDQTAAVSSHFVCKLWGGAKQDALQLPKLSCTTGKVSRGHLIFVRFY